MVDNPLESLCECAVRFGLIPQNAPESELRLLLSPGSPLSLSVETRDSGELVVSGSVRVFGNTGDKTQADRILGALWAIALQTSGETSVFVVETEHPVVEDEIYARNILMRPSQCDDFALDPQLDGLSDWFGTVRRGGVCPERVMSILAWRIGCTPTWVGYESFASRLSRSREDRRRRQ